MPEMHRIVVVGGGFGGLYAVKSLKHASVQITLLDRRNFHLFQPLLYQVATGTLSVGNIAASLRNTLKHQKNTQVLLGEMTDLDVKQRRVILKDGTLPYDSLIIATGSEPFYMGHDDWRPYAPGLKTIEDATTMRARILRAFESAERENDPQRIQEWLTFVIAGGGPTGVELAGALAEVARKTLRDDFRKIRPESAKIILVNGEERVLPDYAPDLSQKAEAALKRLQVVVRNKILITDVQPDAVTLGQGDQRERIPTRTVLWAAGVRASPLGRVLSQATGAEMDKQGRLKVGPDLSLPGHAEIFVIGDLACVQQGTKGPLPGVAPVAMQEGRYVARLLEQGTRNKSSAPFHYRHWGSLATIGRNKAVADLGWVRFNGSLAWFAWAFVHLLYIVEFEDRILVMLQWMWSYLTWNRSDLLITYAPPAPPKDSGGSPR
jgi:NADH dehydrogenase